MNGTSDGGTNVQMEYFEGRLFEDDGTVAQDVISGTVYAGAKMSHVVQTLAFRVDVTKEWVMQVGVEGSGDALLGAAGAWAVVASLEALALYLYRGLDYAFEALYVPFFSERDGERMREIPFDDFIGSVERSSALTQDTYATNYRQEALVYYQSHVEATGPEAKIIRVVEEPWKIGYEQKMKNDGEHEATIYCRCREGYMTVLDVKEITG